MNDRPYPFKRRPELGLRWRFGWNSLSPWAVPILLLNADGPIAWCPRRKSTNERGDSPVVAEPDAGTRRKPPQQDRSDSQEENFHFRALGTIIDPMPSPVTIRR
jgi:hypothetical protein